MLFSVSKVFSELHRQTSIHHHDSVETAEVQATNMSLLTPTCFAAGMTRGQLFYGSEGKRVENFRTRTHSRNKLSGVGQHVYQS